MGILPGNASDYVAVVEAIDPDATTDSTVTSGWVDAKDYDQFMAIFMAGTLGTSATFDGKIEQASDSSGTGAKDVTSASITQLTQAGTDSDKQAIINFDQDDLDVDNNFNHVRLSLTIGTATSDAGALLLGIGPRYAPASDDDTSTVDEIVSV